MFNGKINELKEFLLLPSFIAVIRFPLPCGGGGGGKNLVMVVVVVVQYVANFSSTNSSFFHISQSLCDIFQTVATPF